MLTRIPIFGVLALVGLGYWAWDASHHDHGGPHGQPMTISQMNRQARGTFTDEGGVPREVRSADCRPGEDGHGSEPNTHYVCDLTFSNGSTDNVVVHVLPNELMFRSSEG